MRFMMLVKHAEELSGPPPKALMDAIDKLTEEANKAGTMVTAGGLAPLQIIAGQIEVDSGVDARFAYNASVFANGAVHLVE